MKKKLGRGDQLILERLCKENTKAVSIVSKALINGGDANMDAARAALEPFLAQSHSELYWWLTFDSDPEIVERTYQLFSFPFESPEDALLSISGGYSVGAGGVHRFHYLTKKLKAEGYTVRNSESCPGFPEFRYGGYDSKAESLWELFNVLSTGDAVLFAKAAVIALKAMSQADISIAVLSTLVPDREETIRVGEASWHGVRLGCLVATRSWSGDKEGRQSLRAHKKDAAAEKDFDKKFAAAKEKLGA